MYGTPLSGIVTDTERHINGLTPEPDEDWPYRADNPHGVYTTDGVWLEEPVSPEEEETYP